MRAEALFGNLDEIHSFHALVLEPELERCGVNPAAVARVFLQNCQNVKTLYSSYCQNMQASRQALEALGGESNLQMAPDGPGWLCMASDGPGCGPKWPRMAPDGPG